MSGKEIKETDIYDYIARRDLSRLSTEELKRLCGVSDCAVSGLMNGLKAMGSMGFWASANKDYPESQARDDFMQFSESLTYTASIIEALNANIENGRFIINLRQSGENRFDSYTEKNNE